MDSVHAIDSFSSIVGRRNAAPYSAFGAGYKLGTPSHAGLEIDAFFWFAFLEWNRLVLLGLGRGVRRCGILSLCF